MKIRLESATGHPIGIPIDDPAFGEKTVARPLPMTCSYADEDVTIEATATNRAALRKALIQMLYTLETSP